MKKLAGSDWKHDKENIDWKQRKKENSNDDGNDDDAHRHVPVLCLRRGTHLAQCPVVQQEKEINAAVHTAAAGLLSPLWVRVSATTTSTRDVSRRRAAVLLRAATAGV